MGILAAILGVLVGAWINNVFTWKIKNRVDALDKLYTDVLDYSRLFMNFCKIDNLNLIMNHNKTAEFGKLGNNLGKIIYNSYLYTYIVDGCQGGKIYQLLKEAYMSAAKFIDNEDIESLKKFNGNPNEEPLEPARTNIKLFNNLCNEILLTRKEVTSFCYMLKECNPFKICTK